MKNKRLVITMDGPAAAGKSTLAKLVANKLDYVHLSTGLLYRAVAMEMLKNIRYTAEHSYKFEVMNGESRLLLDGIDITDEVKKDKYSSLASQISQNQDLRIKMLNVQREVAKNGGVVAEGRDTGRIVFPDADLKYWITASTMFRAEMRRRDLERNGKSVLFDDVYIQLLERDRFDASGDAPSLVKTDDMIVIDTTHMNLELLAEDIVLEVKY